MNTLYRCLCFFYNNPSTTEIYTLSLHDALPIFKEAGRLKNLLLQKVVELMADDAIALTRIIFKSAPVEDHDLDRKSTRLNSSHLVISYAVFCLKKKIM